MRRRRALLPLLAVAVTALAAAETAAAQSRREQLPSGRVGLIR